MGIDDAVYTTNPYPERLIQDTLALWFNPRWRTIWYLSHGRY